MDVIGTYFFSEVQIKISVWFVLQEYIYVQQRKHIAREKELTHKIEV